MPYIDLHLCDCCGEAFTKPAMLFLKDVWVCYECQEFILTQEGVVIRVESQTGAFVAIDDETYDGDPATPVGTGPTEQDAVHDLIDQLTEKDAT